MKRKFLRGKLLVWLLAVMLIVASMTGCGGKEEEDKETKSKTEQSVDEEEEEDDEAEDKDSEATDEDTEVVDAKEDEESEEKVVEEEVSSDEVIVEEDEEVRENVEAENAGDAYGLVKAMADACQDKIMTKSTMDMELQMSIVLEGFAIDMDMAMTGDTYASEEPYMSYSDLVLNMTALGESVVENTKSYTVVEDGKLVTYTYTDSIGQWDKEDTGVDAVTMKEQQMISYEFLLNKAESDFVLDSKIYNMNGREAYKLSFTLTGEELQNSVNGMAGMEDLMAETGMEGLDMSSLAVPTVYYVDAESYLIVGMEMSIEGMDEMLSDMMEELMAAEGEEYSMSFKLGKCSMVYSNISYDPVEIPELPEDVLSLQ